MLTYICQSDNIIKSRVNATTRKCRNWQTSKTKDLVSNALVWVQVPSSALKKVQPKGWTFFVRKIRIESIKRGHCHALLWGAEGPVDLLFAPTGAERRPSPIFRITVRGLEYLRNQAFWAFFFGKSDDIVGFPEGSLREIVTIRI